MIACLCVIKSVCERACVCVCVCSEGEKEHKRGKNGCGYMKYVTVYVCVYLFDEYCEVLRIS